MFMTSMRPPSFVDYDIDVLRRNPMATDHAHLEIAHLSGPRPVRHMYVSNGCVHEEHDDCKIECYYCGRICQCDCHLFAKDTLDARERQFSR